MKYKLIPTLLLSGFLFAASADAQVKLNDASNFQVVKQLPSIKESMPKLTGDPWIFQAYKDLYGANRKPNAWELNIKNYNNGSWTSYEQLKQYVAKYQNMLMEQGIEMKSGGYNGNVLVAFFKLGKQVAVNVVAAGGGNVVAAGGANVVAAGGANVVAAGGANVVAAGGGNLVVNKSFAAAKPGAGL